MTRLLLSLVVCALGLLLLARRSRDLSAHEDDEWVAERPHGAEVRPLRPVAPWDGSRAGPAARAALRREWAEVERELGG